MPAAALARRGVYWIVRDGEITAMLYLAKERAWASVNPPHPDPTIAMVGLEAMSELSR